MYHSDIVDIRDIVDHKEDDPKTYELWSEAISYDLGDSIEYYAEDEPTFIHENYFQTYAEQLADDCGYIPNNLSWPINCIDWEQAANELKYDYSSVEVDGTTYYVRSI